MFPSYIIVKGKNMITDNINATFYVVKVNGANVSTPFTERMMAEMAKNNLPEEQKHLAEVVPVTSSGQQILLG